MKGVYVLVIDVSKDIQEKIGCLGNIRFPKGTYAYVGSAQNNLEKRVARHRSKKKTLFWHIDYLLNNEFATVTKVFCKKAGKAEECKLANSLSKAENMVQKFGCSDCRCKSHLLRINGLENILNLGVKELRK